MKGVRTPALDAKRAQYESDLGIPAEQAEVLTRDTATATLFEQALQATTRAQAVANWIVNEMPRDAREQAATLPVSGRAVGELVDLVETGRVSSSAGREVMAELLESGGSPAAIVERRGLGQLNDEAALRILAAEVIAGSAAKVDEYRAGRTGLLGFFIGQVMARSGGRANPGIVRRLVQEQLDG